MKHSPILFNEQMSAAIRQGRKTQTRRIVKSKYPFDQNKAEPFNGGLLVEGGGWQIKTGNTKADQDRVIYCQHGKVGDRLWVRETHFLHGYWKKNGLTAKGRQKWRFVCEKGAGVKYLDNPPFLIERTKLGIGWTKRVSIHMPRWASRLTLEITNVKVERLNDISLDDAKAEGLGPLTMTVCRGQSVPPAAALVAYQAAFKLLWESINGPDSWTQNPWVWAYFFKVVPQ